MVIGVRPQGNCSISGKVVAEATGKPIENARMYLHYSVTHGSIFVNTDSDGGFAIKNLPKGPFSLIMSHTPGYQDAHYSPEGQRGHFPQFSLKDGENRVGVVLKAKEAYRISGHIRDEHGEKPENLNGLTVLAWVDLNGHCRSEQAMVNRVDGSYKIDGLDGKPVYVMALNWRAAREGNAFSPIYYPGVFSRSDAKAVAFDKGQNADNIDITLRKEGGLVLEGTVPTSPARPFRKPSSSRIIATCLLTSPRPTPTRRAITRFKAWEMAIS